MTRSGPKTATLRSSLRRALATSGISVALAAGLAPIGRAADQPALTLYSAQHEQMVDQLTAAFTKEIGIAVKVRQGEAPEIANQILTEGAASPADVYFTENSPELVLLGEKGMLAKVKAEDGGGLRLDLCGGGGCTWCLVAEGDGPFIPAVPGAALVRKLANGELKMRGAMACQGLLALADIAPARVRSRARRDPGSEPDGAAAPAAARADRRATRRCDRRPAIQRR